MKRAVLSFLFVALLLQAHADDSPYRISLTSSHERYRVLNAERNDYRKPKPGLPPAQEDERLRLLGQLLTEDPVWALQQQLQADIDALLAVHPQTPADAAILSSLKDLLAITSLVEDRPTTRAQAEQFAIALRQFIARRDVDGAHNWAKVQ